MSKEKKYAETPLMKQYYDIKAVHPDAILLFRVGDFYETFGDDAIRSSSILGITLTRRANGSASSVELAGFPHHALDTYLPKLVRAGERVAVCEQLEDPKTSVNKIVKRGVIELVTPGISFSDNILNHKENNFLAAVCLGARSAGAAFLDASTGEFYAAEGSVEYISKLISNLAPKEVLYQKERGEEFAAAFPGPHHTFALDKWVFSPERNREKLTEHFKVRSLRGFGIDGMEAAVTAAGAILYYLDFTEHKNTGHISSISRIDEEKYVWIDKFSIHNLELFSSNGAGGRSFAEVVDRTVTPMGARMLKRWIALPLRDKGEIEARLDIVDRFIADPQAAAGLSTQFSLVGDLERLASKVSVGRITPREVVQLKSALSAVGRVKEILKNSGDGRLEAWGEKLDPCLPARERIEREIYPDPSNQIQKGGVIADGVSLELDDLRNIALNGKRLLSEIQERESEITGIPSLKISFNNVFGYYIEVRNTHKDKVPAEWVRKQTLVGAERYITAELKEYEEKILGAEERILALEQRLFTALVEDLASYTAKIQRDASAVAHLDCLLSFAKAAAERKYCRPQISDADTIDIKQGRHPVIETLLPLGEEYVPNDLFLDGRTQQIMMITGPNMSGKSALLRQSALIVLMAQIGSYVPAASAEIGIVDKIFTRVGASDNISQGESTFMVEMLESAGILNNVTPRSLVLLDEIGRGTSTYDGISIAWAMVEYLHERPGAAAKTLFATHYHELNEMEAQYPRVKNYNVAIKEAGKSILFLHKLMRGGTAHSFGIHVAKMAGMPSFVVNRANEILKDLEASGRSKSARKGDMQLSIFQMEDPVLKAIRDEIRDLQIDNLTPLEALNKLNEIKKISGL